MTTARKKRSEIRDAIRSAAIREFARNGLEGTSTQAIAQAAGISKAQLHYYISSKEDLYQEALGYIVSEWKELFFLAASPEDPAEVITDYIRRKIQHSIEYPDVARLFSREMARGAPEMAPHWENLGEAVEEANAVIRKWIDDGLIRPVDPLLLQINMWAVTQHYAEYEAQVRLLLNPGEGGTLDAEPIVREAAALFLARCGLDLPGAG